MEFVQGDLFGVIRYIDISYGQILEVAEGISLGLEAIHHFTKNPADSGGTRFVHCDIKSPNILVDLKGHIVKIADFGFLKLLLTDILISNCFINLFFILGINGNSGPKISFLILFLSRLENQTMA